MRTATLIGIGILLWAIGLGLARRFGKPGGTAVADTTLAFVTFWLLATATNVWSGIAHAGYTLREELPIAVLVFAIPAGLATFVKRKFF